jgi:cell division protein FtsI/penicillin-binding protein 2
MRRKKRLTQPLIHAMQIRRLCFFAGCLLTAFGALAYRLVDLQVVQHERFVEAARRNTEKTVFRHSKRGDIRDIHGNLLATSKIVHTICADPHVLGTNYTYVAEALAPILEMPVEELEEKLEPRTRIGKDGSILPVQYVVLKRKVELENWQLIQETMRQLSFGVDESGISRNERARLNRIRLMGIRDEPEEIRFYPNQNFAAHVLGYVGDPDQANSLGRHTSLVGKDGLERALNDALTGVSGWRQIETDSRRREVVHFREQDVAPRAGQNAILTLDSGIQHIVEDELKAAAGRHNPVSISCIVVRPKTGQIVAMASVPNFNPNTPGEAELNELRNRIISDQAEPGSTFKIVVVAAGLNENKYDLDDLINCENGKFWYAGRPLHDDHPAGLMTVERVISKSSNIGSAKIAIELGKETLHHYVRQFGFGEKTGILLPWEINGVVHHPKRWSGISITRVPMGHEIACTPLQMVMAMSAIANGGVLMRPQLVDRFVDQEGAINSKFEPQVIRRVISESTAKKMVTALKATVSTNGTAMKAKLEFHTAAGKTGTAQKIVDGKYVRNKHYASFIGFFPADNPELCISVVLDEPRKGTYGGETAAPVFKRIAERAAQYLAIPPDPIPEQTLAANASMKGAK